MRRSTAPCSGCLAAKPRPPSAQPTSTRPDYYRNRRHGRHCGIHPSGARTRRTEDAEIRPRSSRWSCPSLDRATPRPGIRSLQLALAARIDDYSLYSDATKNPKVGITWKPTDDLLVRASCRQVSRTRPEGHRSGQRAQCRHWPLHLFRLPLNGSVNSIRWPAEIRIFDPETEHDHLRRGFNPQSLPGLRAGATYFSINYDDIIDQPGGNIASGLNSGPWNRFMPPT